MSENTYFQHTNPQPTQEYYKSTKKLSFEEIAKNSILKITDEIPEMPVCLEIEQKGKVFKIATLGNILLIQAKAKAGKTYFTSALVASLLCPKQFIYFKGSLPPDKRKVIYFDTEQGNEDARTVQERIYKMASLPTDLEAKYFEYYCLRRLSASDRCKVIENVIRNSKNLGVVVIDGVRDLINDFNDTGQSFSMINDLMAWTDEFRINIIAILHQNPNDEKARGHLGTELTNKAEFIISLNKDHNEENYRRVEGYGRRKSFSSFNYSLDENDFPVISSEQREAGKIAPLKIDLQTHKNLLEMIYSKEPADTEFSLNGLYPKIKMKFKIISQNYSFSDAQCKELIHFYLDKNLLINIGTDEKMKLKLKR
jgi:hypothetical protein